MSREIVPVTRAVLVPDDGPTLCACVPRFLLWFEFVRHRSASTIQNYRFDLERGFLPFADQVGLVHPAAVRFQHLETYLGWLQHKKGVSARTANRHLHSLRALWRYLLREGVTTTNPPADVFLLPESKRVVKRLSIPEIDRLLAALAANRTPTGWRDHALIATPLYAGLRCQELSLLRVKDIDLESRRLTVVSGKGDKGRELAIVPRLEAILRGYLTEGRPALLAGLAPSPWLFVRGESFGAGHSTRTWSRRHAGKPLVGRSIFWLVRRVIEPILGRPIAPHTLRHSFASRLRENGAPLELISECLGHAALTTTMIYAKITTKKRHEDPARYLEGTEEA